MKNYFQTPENRIYCFDDYTPSGSDWEELPATKGKQAYKNQCAADLRALIPAKGGKVWAMVKHVARSGMSRTIAIYIVKEGDIMDISHLVAGATEYKLIRDSGVSIGGCGMDMRFALMDSCLYAMYGKEASANNLIINAL